MNYHNITKCDMLNGDGLRVVLWVSGCEHHCKECHNPLTWDPQDGLLFDQTAKQELYLELSKNYISGITFSGGDPLYPSNRDEILTLCKEIRSLFPDKTIWFYTGYTFEQIRDLELMSYIDVLVDGTFQKELADSNLMWKGSKNQRVIDVIRTRKEEKMILKCDDYKICSFSDGSKEFSVSNQSVYIPRKCNC